MQHYTTIEQSKKLLELGMNPETADMNYYYQSDVRKYITVPMADKPFDEDDLPCWSLSALLEVMPPYLFEWERGIDLNIYRSLNGKGWHVSYMPNNINDMQTDKFRQITHGDTPIEAAFNMVVWLLEHNLIQNVITGKEYDRMEN